MEEKFIVVIGMVDTVLGENCDATAEVLLFLSANQQNGRNYYVDTLYSIRNNPGTFRAFVNRLVEDARKVQGDAQYTEILHEIWRQYNTADPDLHGEINFEIVVTPQSPCLALVSFAKAVQGLPRVPRQAVAKAIIKLAGKHSNKALVVVNKAIEKSTPILAAVLCAEAVLALYKWWRGEITGPRCAATIIDAVASTAGGLGGCMLGTAIGTACLPGIGTAIGAVVGGAAAGIAANSISTYLTKWIFDLSPSAALDRAYAFMGLSPTCTNEHVNQRFRHKALVMHPDKGGTTEQWLQLQVFQQTIKMSREGRG
jgi:hypothetical protein